MLRGARRSVWIGKATGDAVVRAIKLSSTSGLHCLRKTGQRHRLRILLDLPHLWNADWAMIGLPYAECAPQDGGRICSIEIGKGSSSQIHESLWHLVLIVSNL